MIGEPNDQDVTRAVLAMMNMTNNIQSKEQGFRSNKRMGRILTIVALNGGCK